MRERPRVQGGRRERDRGPEVDLDALIRLVVGRDCVAESENSRSRGSPHCSRRTWMKTSIGTTTAEGRQGLEADRPRILLVADAAPGARLERPVELGLKAAGSGGITRSR